MDNKVMNNKVLKAAVIGVHGFGDYHIRAFLENQNAQLVMICDCNEDYAKKASEKYNIPYTTSYDEILANDEINAVSLAIPDQLHCEFVIKALNAGKDVLCEKPLALKIDECKKMIKASAESGNYLMVGQICRFTPSFVKAKELVDEGAIGELFFVESEYAHDYSHMTCEWRKNDPLRDGMVGGACHAVDLLRWIAGNPSEVFAYANHKVLTDWPTNDCTVAIMKFPNDVIGKVFCSTGCKRNYTMRTVLYGTKGTIIVDNTSPSFSLFRSKFENSDKFAGIAAHEAEIKIPVSISNHNIFEEVNEFCNCIVEQRRPILSANEGAATVSICIAAVESAKTHKPVNVDYDF